MPEDRKNLPDTRMIFMGDSALANGFRLAGFDVYPDADDTVLDALLRELRETRQRAFVVLDDRLAECDCKILDEVRNEGGRILLAQVPPLHSPDRIRSSVDARIAQLLGEPESNL